MYSTLKGVKLHESIAGLEVHCDAFKVLENNLDRIESHRAHRKSASCRHSKRLNET